MVVAPSTAGDVFYFACWKLATLLGTLHHRAVICFFGNLHKMSVSSLNVTLLCFHAVADQMLLLRKVLQSRRKRSCCHSEETQQRPHLQLLSCVCKTHARWALKKRWLKENCFLFLLTQVIVLPADQIDEASVELETIRDSRDMSLCTLMALVYAEKKKSHPGKGSRRVSLLIIALSQSLLKSLLKILNII